MAQQSAIKSSNLHDGGLRWQVLSHTDLPSRAAIAWIRVSPTAAELTTALVSKDRLAIEETGVVAFLHVKNRDRVPMLLPSDLIVDGGKQARVVEQSVVVPAFAELDVPVRCVEAGRWHARDVSTAKHFEVQSPATISSREHLAKLKQRSYAQQKSYTLDQREVWSHVSSELQKTRVTSQTSSYTAFLGSREQRVAQAKLLAITPPPNANALALVKPLGGVWIEALPTPEALREAVTTVIADALDASTPHGATIADASTVAEDAMSELALATLIALDAVKGTSSRAYAFDGAHTAGQVLLYGNRLAHLTATVGF